MATGQLRNPNFTSAQGQKPVQVNASLQSQGSQKQMGVSNQKTRKKTGKKMATK